MSKYITFFFTGFYGKGSLNLPQDVHHKQRLESSGIEDLLYEKMGYCPQNNLLRGPFFDAVIPLRIFNVSMCNEIPLYVFNNINYGGAYLISPMFIVYTPEIYDLYIKFTSRWGPLSRFPDQYDIDNFILRLIRIKHQRGGMEWTRR